MDENEVIELKKEGKGKKFWKKAAEIGGVVIKIATPVLTLAQTLLWIGCFKSAMKDTKPDFSSPSNEVMEVKPTTTVEPSAE